MGEVLTTFAVFGHHNGDRVRSAVVDPIIDAKAWVAGVFDRAAPTYDEVAGAYHDHFGVRLIESAGVGPGDVVLDVGCGRGAVLVPAGARVGSSGSVVGVDLSPEMVRLATERADAAGIAARLEVMDAEHLDVPDGSFSVVLCGFGIFFLPDPERAAAGFRRALAGGGRLGVSTWGPRTSVGRGRTNCLQTSSSSDGRCGDRSTKLAISRCC